MDNLAQGIKQFFNEFNPALDIHVGYQVKDVNDLYRIWFAAPDTIFHLPHAKRYYKITKVSKSESFGWLFYGLLVEPDTHWGSELTSTTFNNERTLVVYKTGDE